MKTGKNNYTIIDDNVIEKITCVQAFKDANMNIKLHNHHKKLLRYAKNRNSNKEVGFFWDLNDVEKECLKIKGKLEGFNISENPEVNQLIKYNTKVMSVVVMHNHPRNGLFSRADIRSFIDFDTIFLMTAVCNDGTIYILRKERNFNPLLMEKYYNDGVQLSEKAAYRERMNKAKKLGLDKNNIKDREKINQLQTKAYYFGIQNVAKHQKEIGITYRCSVKRK